MLIWASLVASGKASTCDAGDVGSIPGSGRSPGGGNGNPLQYFCLENPMERAAWGALGHKVTESDMTEVTSHAYVTSLSYPLCFRNVTLCPVAKRATSALPREDN